MAAIGLTIGLIDTALISSGAIGWLIDRFVTTLFEILPGLFMHVAPQRINTKATQIIQWSMFGNADNTGNEGCQQGIADKGPSPNCVAHCCPGVINSTFRWERFDAIAFMIQFGGGCAMSIPHMTAAFAITQIRRPEYAFRNCANLLRRSRAASHKRWLNLPEGYSQGHAVEHNVCDKPRYSLNRNLIILPSITQTAQWAYDNIIDIYGQGGTCEIVDASLSGVRFPDCKFILFNNPVSIACGNVAYLNISNLAVSLEGITSVSNASLTSYAENMTDGNGGEAQMAAPPSAGFQNPTASDALCLLGTQGSICLPNRIYTAQIGIFAFKTSGVEATTFPPSGGSLNVNNSHLFGLAMDRHTYITPQNGADSSFAKTMHHLDPKDSKDGFDFLTPAENTTRACLFTETDYQGDVIRFGVGGGYLPPAAVDNKYSVAIYGSGCIYGQVWQAQLRYLTLEPDEVALGTNQGYGGKVKAWWIAALF